MEELKQVKITIVPNETQFLAELSVGDDSLLLSAPGSTIRESVLALLNLVDSYNLSTPLDFADYLYKIRG